VALKFYQNKLKRLAFETEVEQMNAQESLQKCIQIAHQCTMPELRNTNRYKLRRDLP
jgi:hypothetical protein